MSSRSIFSKEDLLSSNLELPSIAKLASIFKTRKFKLELLPFKEGEIRLFKANYASCNYSTIVKWPINTTNLNTYYRNKHFNINYNNNSNLDSDSNNKENSTIESNVPHGFVGYTGSRATFAKPSLKLLRFSLN
jgi:hypothetical protein